MIKLTDKEIEALHSFGGARRESYSAIVLDKNGVEKGIELGIIDGNIMVNADYEVKQSATLTIYDVSDVDLLSDKIQIFMHVNEFAWSMGVFIIVDVEGNTLSLADETIKLQQAKTIDKKVFHKGTYYVDALKWFIVSGINSIKFNIQSSEEIIPADIVIDDSKSLLYWFNYIADQINYRHLYVDNEGYFRSDKYVEPSFDKVGYRYFTDKYSVMTDNYNSDIDLWNVPNVFKRVVSRGDISPLVSIYVNDDPSNRFSTVSRGFKIVDSGTVDLISTQEELDLYVSRLALKAQQIEEVVKFTTANMPNHEIYDIIELDDGVYEEFSYSINLDSFSQMTHHARRVIHGFDGIRQYRERQASLKESGTP